MKREKIIRKKSRSTLNKQLKSPKHRMLLTAVFILLQMAWIVLFFAGIWARLAWVASLVRVIGFFLVLYILYGNANSAYKISWMLLIMAVPLFGILFYLAAGNKKPAGKYLLKLQAGARSSDELLLHEIRESETMLKNLTGREFSLARYLLEQGRFPLYQGTKTTYYKVGEQMFEDMKKSLLQAKKSIYLEFYIIGLSSMWDEILAILRQKKEEGVDVRVIYDDLGSMNVIPKHYDEVLSQMGIPCAKFNPVVPAFLVSMNNRDHRKFLVVDGEVAFTGGINIADEYVNRITKYGHWKDTGMKVEGPGARSFWAMFLSMWSAVTKQREDLEFPETEPVKGAKGYVQPYSDSPYHRESLSLNVFLDLFAQAKKSLYIFTPYLLLEETIKNALVLAAKRGVDVRVGVPGIPDSKMVYRITRSNYNELLQSGVQVYEYTPGFLHAKNILVDDEIGVVGTANFDFRSYFLHYECGLVFYGTETVEDIKQDFLETFRSSRQVSLEALEEKPVTKLFDACLKALSPLL